MINNVNNPLFINKSFKINNLGAYKQNKQYFP